MKIQYYSDLHLEFDREGPLQKPSFQIPNNGAEVFILAGDIHQGEKAFEWLVQQLKNGGTWLYINGNHEYYRFDYTDILAGQRDFQNRVNKAAEELGYTGRIHIGNDSIVDIGDYRFILSTMWTSFGMKDSPEKHEDLMTYATVTMNDYRIITYNHGVNTLIPQVILEDHLKHVKFIENAIDDSKINIVVTHHAPSYDSIDFKYRNHHDSDMNAFYYENMEYLFPRVKYWIHGHVHSSFNYVKNGCRVLSNPRGYKNYEENPKFDPNGSVLDV